MIDLANAIPKLLEVEARYERLTAEMAEEACFMDPDRLRTVSKERAEIEETVQTFQEFRTVTEGIAESELLLEDESMRDLAREELDRLIARKAELESQLLVLLVPVDPLDSRDVFLEIRAGTGGEEAALFAADLFRMYCRYAEGKGWRVETTSVSETEIGGLKEVVAQISGRRVYSALKYEGGVHRVQRIPTTEAQGRIHTSAVTVAVLPEVDDVDIQIDDSDLRIDTYRASGAGGQHINKTDSAVRMTHIPSGIVVTCQDERSQQKNRIKAMRVLRARLAEEAREKTARETQDSRRAMVGSGDRSERIRTYNYPQNRLTDHRIGLTLYKLDLILEGALDDVIAACQASFAAQALSHETST